MNLSNSGELSTYKLSEELLGVAFWVFTVQMDGVVTKVRATAAQSEKRLDYGLNDRGSSRDRDSDENFPLHHRFQIGSEADPASYSMGTGDSFPGVKRPGREADSPTPFTA